MKIGRATLPAKICSSERLKIRGCCGFLVSLQGSHEAAIEHVRRALEISRRIAHRSGETDALYRLGWLHLTQGKPATPDESNPGIRYERAAEFFEQAHALARETGNSLSELHSLSVRHGSTGCWATTRRLRTPTRRASAWPNG
jgi:tetratricopeptide (TPR) repeat protein